MKQIRERQRRMRLADERLALVPDRVLGDPIQFLHTTLNFPIELNQQGPITRGRASAASPWFRGQAPLAAGSRRVVERESWNLLERRMAEQATVVLERYDLLETPVDLDALARRLGLVVRNVALEEDIDGCLLADDDFGAILLNQRVLNHQRRRFTLVGHLT